MSDGHQSGRYLWDLVRVSVAASSSVLFDLEVTEWRAASSLDNAFVQMRLRQPLWQACPHARVPAWQAEQ